jgi:transketolase C-terminal domain/subunit
MRRKPVVAMVLVSAAAGVLLAGLAPIAAASDEFPANRGWEAAKNRGWNHVSPDYVHAED